MLFGPSRRTPSARRARRAAPGAPRPRRRRRRSRRCRCSPPARRARRSPRAPARPCRPAHDEGMVDLPGRLGEARVGALAEHFAADRIDRDDPSGVAVLAQVALRARGVLRRVAGSADQRHRARREQRLRERHSTCASPLQRHSRASSVARALVAEHRRGELEVLVLELARRRAACPGRPCASAAGARRGGRRARRSRRARRAAPGKAASSSGSSATSIVCISARVAGSSRRSRLERREAHAAVGERRGDHVLQREARLGRRARLLVVRHLERRRGRCRRARARCRARPRPAASAARARRRSRRRCGRSRRGS